MTAADPLLRGDLATPPRTLLDILRETATTHPDASALDDGEGALSYRELLARVIASAASLHAAGVRRGDRVGIRMPSGSRDLYIGILGVIAAGAAYVPVDADDPEERAQLVFGEANVVGIITGAGVFTGTQPTREETTNVTAGEPHPSTASIPLIDPPTIDDDAWIIFTSGSTGVPKGVAVSHRSAAAFVDAEANLFLQREPIGPGDRVLAGLSVAFDASCEEMWLAWRYGACLVPAPRSLVRSGMDLGPWLTARRVTIVSTVPTLAALWPSETLDNVRLLIFGGEACPPELAARLQAEGREVWNTYGPTEATVVSCAALLDGTPPVRIGLPLDGWDLAVVDLEGNPVGEGEIGELVIGGVGLARYLDPAKDAEKYAPHEQLGWVRAYRSGDLVRRENAGLVFQGRADDQVKVGGRRIELGEIENALQDLPGVSGAAAAVRSTEAGVQILVGYLAVPDASAFDRADAIERLRLRLPAALVPLLAVLDDLPTRVSGKVDRAALPWPLAATSADQTVREPHAARLADHWQAVLGVPVESDAADFFDLGGGSLAAAQLVSRIRVDHPDFTVAEVYSHPRFGSMAADLAERAGDAGEPRDFHRIAPVPRRMQVLQTLLAIPVAMLRGLRWIVLLLTGSTLLSGLGGFEVLPTASWGLLVPGLLVFATPFGRMALSVIFARMLLGGIRPGDHPRGGGVHLRLWLAEQIALQVGAVSLAGAPWVIHYARALGAKIAPDVDMHTLPPVTGMLTIGRGASIEPEVDLKGYWIDGDTVRIGEIRVGAGSTVGARSTLLPGTRIGKNAEIAAGSSVFGRVPSGQLWAGSPAVRVGKVRGWWPDENPPRGRRWAWVLGLSSIVLSLVPVAGIVAGAFVIASAVRGATSLDQVIGTALLVTAPAVLVAGVVIAALIVALVRLLSIRLTEGIFAVRSATGWKAWSIERLLDLSRTLLFPLYASLFTPIWLRMLGAKVGSDVEASTVLLLPSMTTIRDGAFLADDTLIAPYELGGGWLRIGSVEIGRRAFLGNSGMAAGGLRIPKDSLVAVLSAAPPKSKAGTSWLGSPAVKLQRTVAGSEDDSRTFRPPAHLKVARALWELCRIVPVIVSCALGVSVLGGILWLLPFGPVATIVGTGVLLLAAGAVAAAVSTVAKWTIVGRITAGDHPLWSSFVWRNEVADTFTEMVAAPWFANAAAGSPVLVWWLRSLGAKIGSGVWCETYWLPEADLVTLDDASTVNRGCVVQTHLFHDRIMTMDSVTLEVGATLGPHSVALPASTIGAHSTVGPASLVMRGETVPIGSRFSGNPIGHWNVVTTGAYFTES